MVHSWVQLSEKRPCYIWLVGRMKLASLEAIKFGWGWGLLVYYILLFSLPLYCRHPNMTEILLTGTLSLNSIINQHPQHNIMNLFACHHFSFIQGFSACFMKMSILTYTFLRVLFIICLRPIELLAIAYVLIFNIDPLTQAPRL